MSAPKVTEAQVEQVVREGLEMLGYRVFKTSVKIASKNPKHHRTGQTKGIPDLLVTSDRWAPGMFLGLELKGSETRLSPEQSELERHGRIIVVRCWEDAYAAVRRAELMQAAWKSETP